MRAIVAGALGTVLLLAGCSIDRTEKAARNGEWGCLAGTVAGGLAGAFIGNRAAKGMGGGSVAKTLGGVAGAAGGGAAGQALACK